MSKAWYDELRHDHRPEVVKVLLIGESPPDPAAGERRFFYAPVLDSKDNLYRGVATAAYGTDPDFDLGEKRRVLRRLQTDGYWLIDLSDEPVNHVDGAIRRRALRAAVPGLVERAVEAGPVVGAVVCMAPVHRLVAGPLKVSGIHVLHDDPLPFPMNWSRATFVDGFRAAVGR